MISIRSILAALVAATLFAAPASAAQDPSKPVPADDPHCLVAEPSRACLADDHRQYQGRDVTPVASTQQPVPLMKVDLIVPASGYEEICTMLPDGTSSVTVSRRALVDDAGTDRPLTMTVGPYASTAERLAEGVSVREPVTLTTPRLAGATCFSFENPLSAQQASSVAQAYKYFAQIVTIEAR